MLVLHEDLTRRVIGCAHRLYNAVGSGFCESVYERGMAVELLEEKLAFEMEPPVPLVHRGRNIGFYRPDFIIEDILIVELKALECVLKCHEAQLLNYLRVSGRELGLLVNFSPRTIEVKRRILTPRPLGLIPA